MQLTDSQFTGACALVSQSLNRGGFPRDAIGTDDYAADGAFCCVVSKRKCGFPGSGVDVASRLGSPVPLSPDAQSSSEYLGDPARGFCCYFGHAVSVALGIPISSRPGEPYEAALGPSRAVHEVC